MKFNPVVLLTIFVLSVCSAAYCANDPPQQIPYGSYVTGLVLGLAIEGLIIGLLWRRTRPFNDLASSIATSINTISWVVIFLLGAWWVDIQISADDSLPYPSRSIEVVVPYPAGGGSDTFVRTLQKGFVEDNLLSQPLAVINIAGGGGTIGSRDVKDATPDGYRILCHHNAIITAKLSETVDYGPEAFEPIALTGTNSMVVIVREDAPYATLRDLLEAAKAAPKQLTFGANQGAPAYFTTLQLEKSVPDAQFSIVSADGGADRYAKIIGGHLTAGIFSLAEFLDLRSGEGTPSDRNIRAIVVLGSERHEAIPDVPTALEQDIPVTLSNSNYWWAPKGTPKEVIAVLAGALEKAMQQDTVRDELKRLRIDLDFSQGKAFAETFEDTAVAFEAAVAKRENKIPDFAKWVGWILVVLFLAILAEAWFGRRSQEPVDTAAGIPVPREDFVRRPMTAVACLGTLAVYVYALGQHWLPFAVATILMVFIIGALMTKWQRQHWLTLLQLALLTGLGTTYIFTEVFTTTLP